MKLKSATLKKLIRVTAAIPPDAIGCDECWNQIDAFAELALDGKDAAAALPLLQAHLDLCSECRDEYEALLAALKNLPG